MGYNERYPTQVYLSVDLFQYSESSLLKSWDRFTKDGMVFSTAGCILMCKSVKLQESKIPYLRMP